MTKRIQRRAGVCALSLAAVLAAVPAFAEDKAGASSNQCFYITQFRSWKAPDASTILIRVGFNDLYRLDLASECPALRYPNPHLVIKSFGPPSICSAIDWDLKVVDGSGPGSFATPCIVKAMTKLPPAEAAAVPKKDRPD